MRHVLHSFVLALAAASTVDASAIMYDNGAPDGGRASAAPWYLMADDFTLSANMVLTHVSGISSAGTWFIFDELIPPYPTGLPRPGALLFSGAIDTGADGRVDVGRIPLVGGRRYWLGQYRTGLDACSGGGSDFRTTTASHGARPMILQQNNLGTGGCDGGAVVDAAALQGGWDESFASPSSWSREHLWDDDIDFVFQLHGESSVAEPSLLALCSVGIAWAMRRRRAAHR
jgi:hypothetical protein